MPQMEKEGCPGSHAFISWRGGFCRGRTRKSEDPNWSSQHAHGWFRRTMKLMLGSADWRCLEFIGKVACTVSSHRMHFPFA